MAGGGETGGRVAQDDPPLAGTTGRLTPGDDGRPRGQAAPQTWLVAAASSGETPVSAAMMSRISSV